MNLTSEQYFEASIRQGGVCAVCQNPNKGKKALVTDYDGEQLRGLLCARCKAVVLMIKDQKFMHQIHEYLHTLS